MKIMFVRLVPRTSRLASAVRTRGRRSAQCGPSTARRAPRPQLRSPLSEESLQRLRFEMLRKITYNLNNQSTPLRAEESSARYARSGVTTTSMLGMSSSSEGQRTVTTPWGRRALGSRVLALSGAEVARCCGASGPKQLQRSDQSHLNPPSNAQRTGLIDIYIYIYIYNIHVCIYIYIYIYIM